MERLLRTGATEAVTTIKTEVDASLNRISRPVKDAHRIGLMNLAASCITLLAAAVLLWTTTQP